MSPGTSILSAVANALSVILMLSVEIALLVVALTIVRSKRPDAATPLAAGAGTHVFATLVHSALFTFFVPVLVRSMGVQSMATLYAVLSLIFTVIRAVGWLAMLFGIVRLATPPRANDPTRYG